MSWTKEDAGRYRFLVTLYRQFHVLQPHAMLIQHQIEALKNKYGGTIPKEQEEMK